MSSRENSPGDINASLCSPLLHTIRAAAYSRQQPCRTPHAAATTRPYRFTHLTLLAACNCTAYHLLIATSSRRRRSRSHIVLDTHDIVLTALAQLDCDAPPMAAWSA
jgi:hypothetical protein